MSRVQLCIPFLFISLALLAMPLAAAPTCVEKAAAEHAGVPIGEAAVIEDATPLFLELPVTAEVGDALTFEIRVDDSISFVETIELIRAPAVDEPTLATTPVVELLAAQPARLDFLRRAATRGGVEITIVQDESVVGVYDFDQLAAASAALEQSGARPFDLRSTVVAPNPPTFGERSPLKTSCSDYCDMDQDNCYEYQCEQFGFSTCYDACDADWEDCLASCGFCQTSSTSTTSTTLLSSTAITGLLCTDEFGTFRTGYQREYRQQLKHTTTTTTINSDCTQTVTTSVTYSTEYCYKWISFQSCFVTRIELPNHNC